MTSMTDDRTDSIKWHAHLGIRRWDAEQTALAQRETGLLVPTAVEFDELGIAPYSETEVERNLLTTAGIGRIVSLINAASGNVVSSATARVGVGNGAGNAAVGDTDLSAAAGAANRWFQTCNVTTPGNVLTFAATFGSADGNFPWNEWGVDVGAANVTPGAVVNPVLLNHKTGIAQGTKAAGQTWSATASITIS